MTVEQRREYQRKWKAENKDKIREYSIRQRKKSARIPADQKRKDYEDAFCKCPFYDRDIDRHTIRCEGFQEDMYTMQSFKLQGDKWDYKQFYCYCSWDKCPHAITMECKNDE